MRMLLLAAASLSLAACTTTTDLEAGVQASLPRVCASANTAYAGYVAYRIFRPVPERVDAKVDAAMEALMPLCAAPERATLADVVAAATRLTVAIAAAKQA